MSEIDAPNFCVAVVVAVPALLPRKGEATLDTPNPSSVARSRKSPAANYSGRRAQRVCRSLSAARALMFTGCRIFDKARSLIVRSLTESDMKHRAIRAIVWVF
ncbi:hypothetical protein [Bradyrhizobium yuanmingense]|uniref:hypothetical protein n=1 Tax=Bradyrhizobium yuanmingense TaxID=108015 RepID=UPI001CD1E730|nr:hypothetical protein [Bradyrhizobium yuanmingense]MCA1524322.1 hypothetical protein [Bradyrhizobium yuanmingense]